MLHFRCSFIILVSTLSYYLNLKISLLRLEVLMFCIATMLMVKKMKVFKDAVIGCWKSEFIMLSHASLYQIFLIHWAPRIMY